MVSKLTHFSVFGEIYFINTGFSRKSPSPNLLIGCFELVAGKNGTAISILHVGHNIYIFQWGFLERQPRPNLKILSKNETGETVRELVTLIFIRNILEVTKPQPIYQSDTSNKKNKKAHCIICEDLQGRILQLLGKYMRK